LAAAGAAFAGACAQIANVDDYSVREQSGARSCVGLALADECATCMQTECCPETAQCQDDQFCSSFANCLAACAREDGDCTGRCYGYSHASPKTFATKKWMGCAAKRCASSCLGCADLGPFGTDCTKCATTNGCTQANNCLKDPNCQGYASCLWEQCDYWVLDPACRVKCADLYPEGRERFLPWAAKIGGQCTNECRWGEHFECADPRMPDMPIGASDRQTDLTLRVVSGLNREGVPDLTIRDCNDTDGSCDGETGTDPDGIAHMTIPQSTATPSRTYTRRYFEVNSLEGERELVYSGRSFSGARATVELLWLPEFNTYPGLLQPGKGVLVVQLADCVGSFDPYALNSGATVLLSDGKKPLFYVSPYNPTDLTHESGPFAVFAGLEPGLHEVHVFDPLGQSVSTLAALVDDHTYTLLYVNFPFTQ